MSDLPPELVSDHDQGSQPEGSWEKQLSDWVRARLLAGETNVLKHAMPQIETIMMNAALEHTAGKKRKRLSFSDGVGTPSRESSANSLSE